MQLVCIAARIDIVSCAHPNVSRCHRDFIAGEKRCRGEKNRCRGERSELRAALANNVDALRSTGRRNFFEYCTKLCKYDFHLVSSSSMYELFVCAARIHFPVFNSFFFFHFPFNSSNAPGSAAESSTLKLQHARTISRVVWETKKRTFFGPLIFN